MTNMKFFPVTHRGWKPMRNLMNDDFNQIFKAMEDTIGRDMAELAHHGFRNFGVPTVNVKETPESYVLEVVAPGLNKADFKVELDGSTLTISYRNTETKVEKDDEAPKEKFLRREFVQRSFKRAFTLPETADTARISGVYENGILHLTIAKKEVEAPKAIEIA